MSRVREYFDNDAEREWERLDRHRTEFAVTLRALSAHLAPPPARIADVGGGPGRYAVELAKRGYAVTLIDLSPGVVRLAREHAEREGVHLDAREGDARQLAGPADGSCDAVLLLGPLYHLLEAADRGRAVAEAHRVLRPGSLAASSPTPTSRPPTRSSRSWRRRASTIGHSLASRGS